MTQTVNIQQISKQIEQITKLNQWLPVKFSITLKTVTAAALTGNDLIIQITYPLKKVLHPPDLY